MTTPYFAYGSNLSPRGMGNRCPGATMLGPARLSGWRLHSCRYSKPFPGGVFTIVPDDAGSVWGLLWDVSERDLAALDAHEGEAYERLLVAVDSDGREVEAWVYAMRRPGPWKAPRGDHLSIVLEEGRRHGFRADYLRGVQALAAGAPHGTPPV